MLQDKLQQNTQHFEFSYKDALLQFSLPNFTRYYRLNYPEIKTLCINLFKNVNAPVSRHLTSLA
jgi:hypothetical protein